MAFVNERFREVFVQPGDPAPIAWSRTGTKSSQSGARRRAHGAAEHVPGDKRIDPKRAVVAETIASSHR